MSMSITEEKLVEVLTKVMDKQPPPPIKEQGFLTDSKGIVIAFLTFALISVVGWVGSRLLDSANFETRLNSQIEYFANSFKEEKVNNKEFQNMILTELEIIKTRTNDRFTYDGFKGEIARRDARINDLEDKYGLLTKRIRDLEYKLER